MKSKHRHRRNSKEGENNEPTAGLVSKSTLLFYALNKCLLEGLKRRNLVGPAPINITYPKKQKFLTAVHPKEDRNEKARDKAMVKPKHMMTFDPAINLFTAARVSDIHSCRDLLKERSQAEKGLDHTVAEKLPVKIRHRYNAGFNYRCLKRTLDNIQANDDDSEEYQVPKVDLEPCEYSSRRIYNQRVEENCISHHVENCKRSFMTAIDGYCEATSKRLLEEQEKSRRHLMEHENGLKKVCLFTSEAMVEADKITIERCAITEEYKRMLLLASHFNVENAKLQDRVDHLLEYRAFIVDIIRKYINNLRELTALLMLHGEWMRAESPPGALNEPKHDKEDDIGVLLRNVQSESTMGGILFDEDELLPDHELSEEDLLDKFHQIEDDPSILVHLFESMEDGCLVKMVQIQEFDRDVDRLSAQIHQVMECDAQEKELRAQEIQRVQNNNVDLQQKEEKVVDNMAYLDSYLWLQRYNPLSHMGPQFVEDMDNSIVEAMKYYHHEIKELFKTCVLSSSHSRLSQTLPPGTNMDISLIDSDGMLKEIELEVDHLHECRLRSPAQIFTRVKLAVLNEKRRRQRHEQESRLKAHKKNILEKVKMESQKIVEKFRGRKVMTRSPKPTLKQLISVRSNTVLLREYEEDIYGLS